MSGNAGSYEGIASGAHHGWAPACETVC